MKHPYVFVVIPFEVDGNVVGETVDEPNVVGTRVLDVTIPDTRPTELYAVPTAVLSQHANQENKNYAKLKLSLIRDRISDKN